MNPWKHRRNLIAFFLSPICLVFSALLIGIGFSVLVLAIPGIIIFGSIMLGFEISSRVVKALSHDPDNLSMPLQVLEGVLGLLFTLTVALTGVIMGIAFFLLCLPPITLLYLTGVMSIGLSNEIESYCSEKPHKRGFDRQQERFINEFEAAIGPIEKFPPAKAKEPKPILIQVKEAISPVRHRNNAFK
jgi:hypothetical protein